MAHLGEAPASLGERAKHILNGTAPRKHARSRTAFGMKKTRLETFENESKRVCK